MKSVVDTKISRIPQQVPEQSDIDRLYHENVKIGDDIRQMDDLDKMMTGDDGYMSSQRMSERRVLQLVERMLRMPLNRATLLWHAELRGRISERFRLTREIAGIRTLRDVISFRKTKKEKTIDSVSRKVKQEQLKQGRK